MSDYKVIAPPLVDGGAAGSTGSSPDGGIGNVATWSGSVTTWSGDVTTLLPLPSAEELALLNRLRPEVQRRNNWLECRIVALQTENEKLRAALQAALDGGCSTVHADEDDEIGRHGCCDTLSYKPHAPDCWTLKAKAALRRED